MDEATCNLDIITEQHIENMISDYCKDVTCIIIAHKFSTIKKCDYVYVMNKGTVVEQGKHQDLIALKGLYSEYWKIQNE